MSILLGNNLGGCQSLPVDIFGGGNQRCTQVIQQARVQSMRRRYKYNITGETLLHLKIINEI